MSTILFVDDDIKVLEGLRRMLRAAMRHDAAMPDMRRQWQLVFAEGGEAALAELAQRAGGPEAIDVLVTDMRMPRMNGAQLLEKVCAAYPQVIRFVLSGQSDTDMNLRVVNLAHQFLAKPSRAEDLKQAIRRALAYRDNVASPHIRRLVTGLKNLCLSSNVHARLLHEIDSPTASIQRISQIIAGDLAMSAKILQLSNNAFFGLSHHISCPEQAARMLDLDIIRQLVRSGAIFGRPVDVVDTPCVKGCAWRHGMIVARGARAIVRGEIECRSLPDITLGDHAYKAGLLHDIGRLILACEMPQESAQCIALARSAGLALHEAEREILGTTHAEIGAILLAIWGMPDPITEAVAWHHEPSRATGERFNLALVIHVADTLGDRAVCPLGLARPRLDREAIGQAGLSDRLPVWEKQLNEAGEFPMERMEDREYGQDPVG